VHDALYKKSNWLEGIRVKNHHADAVRDDGAKRAFRFLHFDYKHLAGLGKPAILVACLAGPLGNNLNK